MNILEKSPTKAVPSIRIGVTGHRKIEIAEGANPSSVWNSIAQTARSVLEAADLAMEHLALDPVFEQNTRYRSRLLSGLAEGADCVVAREACDLKWSLHAVLPFKSAAFLEDFKTDQSKAEFQALFEKSRTVLDLSGGTGPKEARNAAYAMAGQAIVENSDLLFAVWDGKEAKGIGGTGDVVKIAIERGILVVRCRPDQPDVLEMRTTGQAEWTTVSKEELTAAIVAALGPPEKGSPARERLDRFQAEKASALTFSLPYRLLTWVFRPSGSKAPFPARLREPQPEGTWPEFFENGQVAGAAREAHRAIANPFAWSDHLSIRYAYRYRSSYVTNFVLAAIAIVAGLFGLFASAPLPNGFYIPKSVFVGMEMILILMIILITHWGRKGNWHGRWLDYRLLAEFLRVARLGVIAGHNVAPRKAVQFELEPGAAFVKWRVRAALREAPIMSGRLDHEARARVIDKIIEDEINPQIEYHVGSDGQGGNAKRLEHLGEGIEKTATWLFIATAIFGLCYLAFLIYVDFFSYTAKETHADVNFADFAKNFAKYAGSVIMAGLPAFAAALSGIAAQGDFENVGRNSAHLGSQLRALRERLLEERDTITYGQLLAVLDDVAAVEIADLGAWRTTYQRKELKYPS